MIMVVLEGGLVSAVVSDDPQQIGTRFCVVDYDIEGADDTALVAISQGDGGIAEAVVWAGEITAAEIKVGGDIEDENEV